MTSRRAFLAIATSTVGAVLASSPAWAESRRKVVVAGRDVSVVDMHAHCLIPEVHDLIAGTRFERTFPPFQLLSFERIEEMNERGIDIQVLSMNVYWWYEADRDLARRVVRLHDEKLADWCNSHSDRFVALTSVALQFPDLAVEQLEHAVTELGFRGASVGGHVRGESLSLSKFDPFWAKAEELNVPVFMHPLNADYLIPPEAWGERANLGNIIGNPLESTIFLSRMIFDGVFDRFPGLTVCVAHGGGYLPSYLGRTEVACDFRPGADCQNKKPPSEYLKNQIVVDSMVFSQAGLRHLVEEVGAGQVVYGSDLPFNWPDTIGLIVESPHLNDMQKAAILGGNLKKLLRI